MTPFVMLSVKTERPPLTTTNKYFHIVQKHKHELRTNYLYILRKFKKLVILSKKAKNTPK